MNHSQAINVVHRHLIPPIQNGEPAHDVLLKYAKDNNLPPAQLEKLAQVLNTARTITFMDKSASRGDTFEIVDIPAIMEEYQKYTPPVVSRGKSADDWFSNGVSFKLASEAAPNLILGEAPIQKEACAMNEPEVVENRMTAHNNWRKEQSVIDDLNIKLATADAVEDEANELMFAEFAKIARAVWEEDPELFAEIEHDMLGEFEESERIKQACDLAAHYCTNKQRPVQIKRAAEVVDPRRVTSDRHGFKQAFETILHALQLRDNAREFRRICKEAANTTERAPRSTQTKKEQDKGNSHSTDTRVPRPADVTDPYSNEENVRQKSEEEAISSLLSLIGKQSPPSSSSGRSITLGGAIDNVLTGSNEALTSANDSLVNLITTLSPSKNVRQERREMAADEVRRVTTIERVLADPVLSKVNPALIVSLYNTLLQNAPHYAKDPNTVKMILRQATQYEGLTPDVMKTVTDIGKSQEQLRQISNENKKQRYALS